MLSLTLTFLTRDGTLLATFEPCLMPDEYAALYEIVEGMDDKSSLTEAIRSVALKWGLQVQFD